MNAGWQEVSRGVIHPWHHDQFGHMNVRWYAHFFDDAVFHLYAATGVSLQAMERDYGIHTVSAQATTNFVQELSAGDLIRIDGGISRLGGKSLTFSLRMVHVDTQEVHATYELIEVFFDPKTRRSTAMPEALREQLSACLIPADAT